MSPKKTASKKKSSQRTSGKKSAKSNSAKKLNWTDQGQFLLEGMVNRGKKSSKAFAAVLATQPGQILFQAPAKLASRFDWNSIGSLVTSAHSALEHLHKTVGAKVPKSVQLGTAHNWVEKFEHWLVVGMGVKYKPEAVRSILKHVKKGQASKGSKSEVLASPLKTNEVDNTIKELG